VFDSFSANQGIGHLADFGGAAAHDQNFETVIVIEVNVKGREDGVMVIVLDGGEFARELADVMIIDEGYGSDYVTTGSFPGLLDKFFPDEIAKGFGTVGVATAGNQLIKLLKQVGGDGDTDAAKASHRYPC